MKYKIKVVVGFRRDQEHSISANEAHKAYYLFMNPEERGVFSNGIALKGDQIQEIVPDYHGTMGWNQSHMLTDDDYNELRKNGVMQKMEFIMAGAKDVASNGGVAVLNTPLSMLIAEKNRPPQLRGGGAQSIKEIMGRARNN